MKIRNYSASLILALWFSAANAGGAGLADLLRAYRQTPTPERRTAIGKYAAANPKDAALASLALGIAEYEQRNYPAAIAILKPLPAQLPAIADYVAYYLAAARVEAADYDGIARDLAATRRDSLTSPLASRSWILEARALKASDPAAAVRLLTSRYSELPQPEGDINMADCYQAAGDLPRAVEYYQRVYYSFLTGDSFNRATAALTALKSSMGAAYPKPSLELQLRRADRLLETKDYVKAKSEYAGIPSDLARVGMGAADYLRGATNIAWPYLRDLSLPAGEADAQRLYYVTECARRNKDDAAMLAAVQRLRTAYPKSEWRLRALTSAANRFLLVNQPDDYVPLYRTIYEDFPASTNAPLAHWKVTFQAWMRNRPDTGALLREHLRSYPTHFTAGASLYFLGRSLEQSRDFAGARACYQRLSASFENQYYAMLARTRLQAQEIKAAPTGPPASADFLSTIRFSSATPLPASATQPTTLRIERSRLLRAAGLSDMADSELRFGARRDGQPVLLGMEMAETADAVHQAMRVMKSMSPDYLSQPFTAAPRRYWELLFPLPYKDDLMRSAQDRNLDPYLIAGLIRQESEFNPQAVSHANAYGLTQVRPATGRQYARLSGMTAFSPHVLTQPTANLKIGCVIFRSMLDAQGGSLEQTLAAYNAGPARVTEWLTWGTYREPAEFVETIPFTETREYVQAVLRNADLYRRLYGR